VSIIRIPLDPKGDKGEEERLKHPGSAIPESTSDSIAIGQSTVRSRVEACGQLETIPAEIIPGLIDREAVLNSSEDLNVLCAP
jgi:hypothetical protein